MANKQSRKSLSLVRILADRIREEAARDGVSASEWVTRLAVAELARRGRPLKTKLTHMSRVHVDRMLESRRRSRDAELAAIALAEGLAE